jgi:hypothetical protein
MPNPIVATAVACALAAYISLALILFRTHRNYASVGWLVIGAGIVVWPAVAWLVGAAFYVAGWSLAAGTIPGVTALVERDIVSVGELVAISRFGALTAQAGLILAGIWMIGGRQTVPLAR